MARLDNVIHQPIRLQIMASLIALEAGEQVDFTYLRELLFKSAYVKETGEKIINPKNFIKMVKAAKVVPNKSK